MNEIRKKRLWVLAVILLGCILTTFFILKALQENINLYYSPTDIVQGKAPLEQTIRGGGLVVKNSLKRSSQDLSLSFAITDSGENCYSALYWHSFQIYSVKVRELWFWGN